MHPVICHSSISSCLHPQALSHPLLHQNLLPTHPIFTHINSSAIHPPLIRSSASHLPYPVSIHKPYHILTSPELDTNPSILHSRTLIHTSPTARPLPSTLHPHPLSHPLIHLTLIPTHPIFTHLHSSTIHPPLIWSPANHLSHPVFTRKPYYILLST